MIQVFLAVGIILILSLVYFYNKLISEKQAVTEAWSDIDVQLKRRHDLIPNLVSTVQGYAKFEKSLLIQITQFRTQALTLNNDNMDQKSRIENDITDKIKTIMMTAEAYPDLKASQQFLDLQKQLSQTEDEIASARRIYNSNVANFNTDIGTFPTNMVVRIMHFNQFSYFQNSANSN
jgi:LemA protein